MKVVQFISTALLIFSCTGAFAQATIKGTLNNQTTRQKLGGASVSLISTSGAVLHRVSGEDGEFKFTDIAKGDYTLEINYVGFKSWSKHITLQDNTIELRISLVENVQVLSNVHVFSKINGEEESSARTSEKNANNITNVISARAMERSPDINAANVLQRMSGITLQKRTVVLMNLMPL